MLFARKRKKICLITGLGGHMQQMKLLKEQYASYKHFYISAIEKSNIDKKDLEDNFYFIADINEGRWLKNPFLFVKALFQTLAIFIKERPDLIISTGPGVAVPGFLLARIFRIPSLFIEAYTRVEDLSAAGKICYRLGCGFLVQHEGLRKKYPRVLYRGPLYKHY